MIPAAVVFDCDGVLVDSEPHSIAAWLEVLGGWGHPATGADVAGCIGLGFVPTHEALSVVAPLPSPDIVWPTLLAALERSFRGGLEVFDDAVAVVDECMARRVPMAVVSASPRARLDLTLAAAGLAGRFGVSVAGDEVPHPKPAPDGYLAAAVGLGMAAGACVAVEDSPAGVRSAAAAGMRVVAVVRPGADGESLEAAGATVVAQLTSELVLGFGAGHGESGSR
ncbi:MAG: hypothetical protein A2Z12_09860 [Actinobacteria bacterium RBG_16_68_21]|nr:MAG: hypothetical protein A2Z12_09860 [Actinobacteria bacterium RBG_16_68_21]